MLERRYRRSGLVSDRLLWIQHERTRHKANRLKESGYWLAHISEHSGQPRKLWRTFSSIMGLDRVAVVKEDPSAHPSLLDFFVQKIDTIRQSTGGSTPFTRLPPATSEFNAFRELTLDEVHRLIMSSKSKSCSLDPLPTNILKDLLPGCPSILPNPISPNPISPNPISPNPVSPNRDSPNRVLPNRVSPNRVSPNRVSRQNLIRNYSRYIHETD